MRDFASFLARRAQAVARLPQRGVEALDILIFVVIAAAVIPVAIDSVFDVDTSGWQAAGTLWDLLPLMIVVGVLIAVVRYATGKRGNDLV